MSLVERALKKIQESRAAAPATQSAGSGATQQSIHMSRVDAAAVAAEPSAPRREPHRVVQIDRAALRAQQILPPEQQERQIADEYRQIKRPIIANAFGRGKPQVPTGQVLMVSSALPGEGKTFTSINLSLSLALEKDLSVVLVDADVAKPHVSSIFDLTQERGLLDLLRDEHLDVDSVILPTNIPGLSILPAGRHCDTATELLASERMLQIVNLLVKTEPNRIILFDSPPLLLTSESRVLAGIVGQIALVVRAGETPQQAVLEALEILGDGKPIGLVLNQCSEQTRKGYYQYYTQRADASEADN